MRNRNICRLFLEQLEPRLALNSYFIIAGYPSPVTAGTANNFTVTVKDASGNTASGYAGTVTFSTSAVKAVLPANYTFALADAGTHTFSAILRSAGTQSLTAKDTLDSSFTGSESGIVVNPATTNHLTVSRFPSPTTAGVSQTFRVTAQDMFGNTTPSFADTVSFSSSDSQAVLPTNYTFTSGDAGVHTFSATLKTAGSQSIMAQDATANVAAGTMSGIKVNPAAANHLQIGGFPSSVIAGTAHSFTVAALDVYGNVATGYRGTVMFGSTDSQSVLPVNYLFTSGDAGAHTFSATLNTQGMQTITATDTAGITGMESGISVVGVQPTAGISGPAANGSGSNGVPGQPLAFALSATESGLPSGTVYSYSVQWGDGSPPQTFSGPSGTQAIHAFPASTNYTVTVTATDPSGNGSLPASTLVSLTTLAMETDPYNSNLTALYLGGTTGSDNIAFTPVAGGGVKVGMNLVNYGSFFPTGHVVVYSQSGNDIIKAAAQTINNVLTYVNVPVLFFAGNGNDVLNVLGSSTNNVLVGGGGTDRLIGGQGKDILIGGAGQATLQAGAGGDILIGGTTTYDNNAAALAAILAEWTRTDIDYTTRIAHLTGNMSGGLNHSIDGTTFYFLNPNTAQGNGLADNLYGGAGMDWYFAGVLDALFNKATGEVVTLTGAQTLNPALPPSGNFNLTNWNLTLPTGTSGSPTVIPTATLDSGYTSQYFYTGSDGAMTFWCPVTGVTTSGSSYPRTELRETKPDGTLYNWNVLDGTATLSATLAVNQVPSTGRIVIGQIHDNGAGGISNQPLIKLVFEYDSTTGTATIVAQIRSTPTSSNTDYTLATGIKLNTQFSYQIQLRSDRTLSVQINGVTQYSNLIDTSWDSQGLYFKAGAYVQDNVGTSAEGGTLSFYALTVTHS